MASRKRIKHHAPYNWDRWFSRKTFTVRRGVHYDCAVHGMASQIRTRASIRGLRVSLEIVDGVVRVTVKGRVR